MQWPAAAAALIVLASGCTGVFGGPATVTARDVQDEAERHAAELDSIAVLFSARGFETSRPVPEQIQQSMPACALPLWDETDAKIGDGKILIWVFEFLSPNDSRVYLVGVDHDQEIVISRRVDLTGRLPASLQIADVDQWRTDSDTAAQNAESDTQWAHIIDASGAVAHYVLYMASLEPAPPVWVLGAADDPEDPQNESRLAFDARNGSQFPIEAPPEIPVPPDDQLSGTVPAKPAGPLGASICSIPTKLTASRWSIPATAPSMRPWSSKG